MIALSRRTCLSALALGIPTTSRAAQERGGDGPPNDAAMIAHLHAHRVQFEALVAMAHQDTGLVRIDEDWTEPGDLSSVGVRGERLADYRRRFKELGIPRGITVHADNKQVDFLAYARGWGPRGFSRSYVWSASGEFPDGEIVPDLDVIQASGRRRVWAFRHVDGPWWLHLRND